MCAKLRFPSFGLTSKVLKASPVWRSPITPFTTPIIGEVPHGCEYLPRTTLVHKRDIERDRESYTFILYGVGTSSMGWGSSLPWSLSR